MTTAAQRGVVLTAARVIAVLGLIAWHGVLVLAAADGWVETVSTPAALAFLFLGGSLSAAYAIAQLKITSPRARGHRVYPKVAASVGGSRPYGER